ncbi:class I SAM-dependent methyltransferase [Pseudomonas sp. RIT-PI-S]|uniref:class I SAM-dependent methyltransferase n=1 Tax=Pseudomonas sp. RIT-PI-S TaxID=3035295 RepID=UPI0021DA6BAC|nr:class I SAM-dependent methyltransferase [Pseudomonas sp. RIT-PI-S]
MSCPRSIVCLAPLPGSSPKSHTPCILLAGRHQPTLLRCLDGWPRRNGKSVPFSVQFVDQGQSLAHFADNRFDLAVVQSPSAEQAQALIAQLIRVARQGLLTLR